MTWPLKVYVATVSGGLYYTANFGLPGGAQPVWTTLNAGLSSTDMRSFCLDRHDYTRMYCIAGSTMDLYGKDGSGDWAVVLSRADARTETGDADGELYSVITDPDTGYVYAVFGSVNLSTSDGMKVARSIDHGANWTWSDWLGDGGVFGGVSGNPGHIDALGSYVAWRVEYSAYARQRAFTSSDHGATWDEVTAGSNQAYDTGSRLWPESDGWVWTSIWVSPSFLLARVKAGETAVATALGGNSGDLSLWFDADDPDHMVRATGDSLYETTDAWDTVVDGSPATNFADGQIAQHTDSGEYVVGIILSDQAVVGCTTDLDSFENRSGTNWDTPPYTDAIPRTAGLIVDWGVWVEPFAPTEGPTPPPGSTITPPDTGTPIPLSGDAYVQAVSMPDYTGDNRGEPMPGDRGAWDTSTEARAKLHARDIRDNLDDSTPTQYHLPEATAGQAPVHDGTGYVATDIATQAELDALTLDDLADVDAAAPNNGDALAYNSTDGEWVPVDVLTPTEHTAIGDSAPHHAAVTLGAGNDADMATLSTQELTVVLKVHDHTGDSGDGGQITVAALDSETATSGQVATADGAGGTAWQTVAAASGELLMQDGVTAPPVPIETEDRSDWLYEG